MNSNISLQEIFSEDNTIKVPDDTWFFSYDKEGSFIWNPKLIKAFVAQVVLEQQVQVSEMLNKIKETNDKE